MVIYMKTNNYNSKEIIKTLIKKSIYDKYIIIELINDNILGKGKTYEDGLINLLQQKHNSEEIKELIKQS